LDGVKHEFYTPSLPNSDSINKVGIGVVIQNSRGKVTVALSFKKKKKKTPLPYFVVILEMLADRLSNLFMRLVQSNEGLETSLLSSYLLFSFEYFLIRILLNIF